MSQTTDNSKYKSRSAKSKVRGDLELYIAYIEDLNEDGDDRHNHRNQARRSSVETEDEGAEVRF